MTPEQLLIIMDCNERIEKARETLAEAEAYKGLVISHLRVSATNIEEALQRLEEQSEKKNVRILEL